MQGFYLLETTCYVRYQTINKRTNRRREIRKDAHPVRAWRSYD